VKKAIETKPAPEPGSGIVGVLILLGVIAFGTAVVLDVGGLGGWFGHLLAGPKSTLPDGGVLSPLPPPPKPVVIGEVTQAWFVDASGYLGAQAEQKATHAPMLIYFRKRPCEVCKQVDHDLLGSPELKKLLEHVIKVRVDVDAGRREWEMTEVMQVKELPALISVSPDKTLHRIKFTQGGLLLPAAQVAAQIR
jgi:hypothetical protein